MSRRAPWWLGALAGAALASTAAAMLTVLGASIRAPAIAALAVAPLPLALLAAHSRRLDRVAERVLVELVSLAGAGALMAGVYAMVALGLGDLPAGSERRVLVLAFGATAGAAVLYRPLRARLLAFGERHLGRARRPPGAVLRSLGGSLSRVVSLEELLLQTAELLRRELGLAAAEVWTEAGGRLVRAASDPDRPRAVLPLGPAAQMIATRARVRGPAWLGVWLPELLAGRDAAAVQLAPITHSGELLGAIVAERPTAGSAGDDELLGDVARQLGPVLRNARLDSELHDSMQRLRRQTAQLRASRARIVTAADAERRRIERNLHDGAQQPLVALSLHLRFARELLARDPAAATMRLEELEGMAEDALRRLRDLAHGIYPPVLMARGLGDALAEAARLVPLEHSIDAPVGRHPADVESAVYFCCVEALQNAARHSEATSVSVQLREEQDALVFEVRDDGRGFSAVEAPHSGGLAGMRDRLEAIGGTLRVESAPGAGTTVAGVAPLGSQG